MPFRRMVGQVIHRPRRPPNIWRGGVHLWSSLLRGDVDESRLNVSRGTIAPGNTIAASSAGERPMRRLMLADCPNFWRLWSVGLVAFTVRWLESVAVGVFVYQHSRSAFLVAMMTMLRLLPMGLFGAFIGAWAEKIERRFTLIAVVMLMLTTILRSGISL
jgi:hypothetical protein